MSDRPPYMNLRDTLDLIANVARADHLTIVAGAGASADWGLPRWDGLLRRMLEREVSRRYDVDDKERRQVFANQILKAHGFIGAASIIRETLGEGFDDALRRCLYEERSGNVGSFALTVADVLYTWRTFGGDVCLVTTNYDTSFETALAYDQFADVRQQTGLTHVASVVEGREAEPYLAGTAPSAIVPVFHLHGLVPIDPPSRGNIVFSEQDYAFAIRSDSWQERLLRSRLDLGDSICLFLGMALSDPNVVSRLFDVKPKTSTPRATRIAIIPLQADVWRITGAPMAPDPATRKLEIAISAVDRQRLATMAIERHSPYFYSQVRQLLNEMGLSKAPGPGKDYERDLRYNIRLKGWRDLMEHSGRMSVENDPDFERIQKENHVILKAVRKLLFQITANFRPDDHIDPSGERFAVHLWGRNPGQKTLELWGSSEAMWLERETLLDPPIAPNSAYSAVNAVCEGATTRLPSGKAGSRWKFSMDSPISLKEGGWHQLPVGVISLQSSEPEDSSCLRILGDRPRSEISQVLGATGALLLTPNVDLSGLFAVDALRTAFGSTTAFLSTAQKLLVDVRKKYEEPRFVHAGLATQPRRSN